MLYRIYICFKYSLLHFAITSSFCIPKCTMSKFCCTSKLFFPWGNSTCYTFCHLDSVVYCPTNEIKEDLLTSLSLTRSYNVCSSLEFNFRDQPRGADLPNVPSSFMSLVILSHKIPRYTTVHIKMLNVRHLLLYYSWKGYLTFLHCSMCTEEFAWLQPSTSCFLVDASTSFCKGGMRCMAQIWLKELRHFNISFFYSIWKNVFISSLHIGFSTLWWLEFLAERWSSPFNSVSVGVKSLSGDGDIIEISLPYQLASRSDGD